MPAPDLTVHLDAARAFAKERTGQCVEAEEMLAVAIGMITIASSLLIALGGTQYAADILREHADQRESGGEPPMMQ